MKTYDFWDVNIISVVAHNLNQKQHKFARKTDDKVRDDDVIGFPRDVTSGLSNFIAAVWPVDLPPSFVASA